MTEVRGLTFLLLTESAGGVDSAHLPDDRNEVQPPLEPLELIR